MNYISLPEIESSDPIIAEMSEHLCSIDKDGFLTKVSIHATTAVVQPKPIVANNLFHPDKPGSITYSERFKLPVGWKGWGSFDSVDCAGYDVIPVIHVGCGRFIRVLSSEIVPWSDKQPTTFRDAEEAQRRSSDKGYWIVPRSLFATENEAWQNVYVVRQAHYYKKMVEARDGLMKGSTGTFVYPEKEK